MPIEIDSLIAEPNFKPKDWQTAQPPRNDWGWGKAPVGKSEDLARVVALPRRPQPVEDPAVTKFVTDRFRKPGGMSCRCSEIRPRKDGKPSCIESFRFIQAVTLLELSKTGGILGGIGVGHGKTIIGICAPLAIQKCKTALLLCPPGLIDQLIVEYQLLLEHYHVPSLVVHGKDWTHTVAGQPVLHVFPYSRLSRHTATTFITQLAPDFVIADECHKLRNADTATTSRLLRYFDEFPDTRFAGWTGSITDSSIKDYAHLAALALKDGSPLPLKPAVVDDWARALDPSDTPAPAGALFDLCVPGEHLYDGFRRRLIETAGVIMTTEAAVDVELVVEEKPPPIIPYPVQEALDSVRQSWVRPDGEELVTALDVARVCRELASGFYYVWTFPNNEPVALIEEWLEARKAYNKELRKFLKDRQEHLDSPHLCELAAQRAYGFVEITDKNRHLPQWKAVNYPAWRRVKKKVKPVTKPVRLHDYLARDAAEWALANRGIVWYSQSCFGEWVAELADLPLHGGGQKAAERIKSEKGDRSIVTSINAHGTGRDGLQYLFTRQLVANPPTQAAEWEQLLGRLHRTGQDESVSAVFYRHTIELKDHVDTALKRAFYIQETLGSKQKLRSAIKGLK